MTNMTVLLACAGLVIQALLFAYFMGRLSGRVQTLEEKHISYKDSVKRIHDRLDDMDCVKRHECHDQAGRFEARMENYQKILCDNFNVLKENQIKMAESLAVLTEKTKDR